MKKTYETWCPLFPGFYGTEFEYEREDDDIESYNEENKTKLGYDDFDWDYADYHKRVTKAFVNKLESECYHAFDFKVKLEFQELHSPREYNFYNDSIWVKATVSIDRMLKFIGEHRTDAIGYFSKYTPCSGFIPFHSNDVDVWLQREYILEDTAHRVGALLECCCEIEGIKEDSEWTSSESYIDFSPKEKEEA